VKTLSRRGGKDGGLPRRMAKERILSNQQQHHQLCFPPSAMGKKTSQKSWCENLGVHIHG